MNLLGTKVLTLFILGVGSFLIGLSTLPLSKRILKRGTRGRWQLIISSLLSCFGGGVLLATTMLHILPETSHGLEERSASLDLEFLPQLILCAGFFLIYLVEEVVEALLGGHGHGEAETLHRTMSVRKSSRKTESVDPHDDMERPNYGSMNKDSQLTQSSTTIRSSNGSPDLLMSHSPDASTSLRELFTILALSTHAVFEGLAVGLEESKADVWKLFIAIACHKFVISFCVCLELVEAGTRKFIFYSYLVIFSLISSLGIGIGIIITEAGAGTVPEVVVATLQGIAGGTLLYVVMFEVLTRERLKEVSGVLQLTAVLVGFGVMLIIEIFGHHDHDHEHHGEGGHEGHHHEDHHHHDDHHHHLHDDHDDHDHDMFSKPATSTVMSLLGLN